MKKGIVILILLSFFFGGCLVRPAELPATETPIPLEVLLEEALSATREAEASIPPSFPYSPVQLASLLEPGKDLWGFYKPSSVTDLSRPYPGLPSWCEEYYGSCWNEFPLDYSYGAELKLIRLEEEMGKVSFLYYQKPEDLDTLYQVYEEKWTEWSSNEEHEVSDTWLNLFNQFDRPPLGDKWLHYLSNGLYEKSGPPSDVGRNEWELIRIDILIFRCHGFVHIEVHYPPKVLWNSPEYNKEDRIKEMEKYFNWVYEYAEHIDERVTPYACNE